MPRLRKKFSELLVITALCAAVILAVSFWFRDSALRALATPGVIALAALFFGAVLWMIVSARALRQPTVLEDAHELSTLAFPPSNSAVYRGK